MSSGSILQIILYFFHFIKRQSLNALSSSATFSPNEFTFPSLTINSQFQFTSAATLQRFDSLYIRKPVHPCSIHPNFCKITLLSLCTTIFVMGATTRLMIRVKFISRVTDRVASTPRDRPNIFSCFLRPFTSISYGFHSTLLNLTTEGHKKCVDCIRHYNEGKKGIACCYW